jgi:hypothetical protein
VKRLQKHSELGLMANRASIWHKRAFGTVKHADRKTGIDENDPDWRFLGCLGCTV